jgi:hypothetical protein
LVKIGRALQKIWRNRKEKNVGSCVSEVYKIQHKNPSPPSLINYSRPIKSRHKKVIQNLIKIENSSKKKKNILLHLGTFFTIHFKNKKN